LRKLREFSRAGALFFSQGLVSASSGNLSVREKNRVYITSSGSFLGRLEHSDIVDIPLREEKASPCRMVHPRKKPSVEKNVHRNIYLRTESLAVAHAHPPSVIALSYEREKLSFEDFEGKSVAPEIPVLSFSNSSASEELEKKLPEILESYPAVSVRGHGAFTAGRSLPEACRIMSSIEFSSRIFIKKKILETVC